MRYGVVILFCCAVLNGCDDGGDMRDTQRYETYEASTFFADGASARRPVEGTVSQESLIDRDPYETGMEDGRMVEHAPVELTTQLLQRGQERYQIYCAPCHGLDGAGKGMVVQRGYTPPATFHQPRLREAEDGYLFIVISQGLGRMPPYTAQIDASDRWAIVGYIRALQLSQHTQAASLTQEQKAHFDGGEP